MKKVTVVLLIFALIMGAWFYYKHGVVHYDSEKMHQVNDIPSVINVAKKEGLVPNGYVQASIVRVVDGDTVEASYKKNSYKVRLLDIDTPESVKSGVPIQVYAKEATEYTKRLVSNQQVKLIFEKGLKDKYGRLLAHIILKDGSYLNAMLVRNGYARVEIISPNDLLTDYFNQLQDEAINEKIGLWGLSEKKRPFVKDKDGVYIPRYWLTEKAS